jgi:hypothetical protein
MSVPFTGETMTCCMCGKEQPSDLKVESQWRAIDYGGRRFYVCPKHFPPDTAPSSKFAKAYEKILRKIASLVN